MGKKNRDRNVEPLAYEIVEDAETPPADPRTLLESARRELETGLRVDMTVAEQALGKRLDLMAQRLHDTRSEIERLHAHTAKIKADPLNEVVRAARARLSDV